jgi:hypothetical protein
MEMPTSRKPTTTKPPVAAPARQPRRLEGRSLALAIAGAAIVIVAIALVVASQRGGGNATPMDGALKAAAGRMLPQLNHAPRTLPISDSSLRSFQAWYYDTEPVFKRLARHPGPRFEELEALDPNPFPPQAPPVLRSPGSPPVLADASTIESVVKTGKPAYTTVQQGNTNYRVYVAPLALPPALQGTGSYMVLQVVQAE